MRKLYGRHSDAAFKASLVFDKAGRAFVDILEINSGIIALEESWKMNKVAVAMDEKMKKEIERRRAAEIERQKRIFNTKNRVIGIDVHALEKQVADRLQREEEEKHQDMAYDTLWIIMNQSLHEEQRKQEDKRKRLEQEIVKFRAVHQRPEDSRDADINYKFSKGPTVSLADLESLGPASMQVFQGEDIGEGERKKYQKKENERTLRAQREDREKCQREQKQKELLSGLQVIKQSLRAKYLDGLEEEFKKACLVALKSYNQDQVEERREREQQEKEKNDDMDLAEVWQMLNSDLLTESPKAALIKGVGSAEAPRVLTDRWKGMSTEQVNNIYRQRAEQCVKKERQRQLEEHCELVWGVQQLEESRQQKEELRREEELEKQRRTQLDQDNQQLAREQHAQLQHLNKEIYTNQPTARYFNQFNTSSR